MRNSLLVGLLVVAAVAVPVASAHLVFNTPVPGSCLAVGVGSPSAGPHGANGIPPCPRPSHGEPSPSLLP